MEGSSMDPKVSFIVPCYKLAHLLPECVKSILGQSFNDFEILIMDDCSPDNTPEVAAKFGDSRVIHVRNEPNLGHLRNYNKGIGLARGQYVWLISADDCLRRDYILERYVKFLESHPEVGYVFSAGVGLRDGSETGILEHYYHGNKDRIMSGPLFVETLLGSRGILSPSVMVRKKCYERLGCFPLDLPHQGDVYLWALWAMHWDVAYFAEPMVSYRLHEQSMMSRYKREAPEVMLHDEVAVLWRSKRYAEKLGLRKLARECESILAKNYASYVGSSFYPEEGLHYNFSLSQCERVLHSECQNRAEEQRIKGRIYARLGDVHYWHHNFRDALGFYQIALRFEPRMPSIWIKRILLRVGAGRFATRKLRGAQAGGAPGKAATAAALLTPDSLEARTTNEHR